MSEVSGLAGDRMEKITHIRSRSSCTVTALGESLVDVLGSKVLLLKRGLERFHLD